MKIYFVYYITCVKNTIHIGIHQDVGTYRKTAGLDSSFPGGILGNKRLGGEFLAPGLWFKGETHGFLAHLYHPQIRGCCFTF